MIVECVAPLPTLPQSLRLGKAFRPGEQEFPLVVGQRYAVFGLRQIGAGSWAYIATEAKYLVLVPLCLFVIVDGRLPAEWRLSRDEEGDLLLAFAEMEDSYFIDDLASAVPAANESFARFEAAIAAMTERGQAVDDA